MEKASTDGARRAGGKGKKAVKQNKTAENPGWASGLRQLYDSVVDEPLPDAFTDLLAKLDRKT